MVEPYFEPVNFDKVDSLIAEGRLFRAKETLHGMTGSFGFHPEIFNKLGDIAFALKEPALAAHYYFFSGVRKPEHLALIDSYVRSLEKYKVDKSNLSRRSSFAELLAEIPKSVRRAGPEKIPANLKKDLLKIGLDETAFETWHKYVRAKEAVRLVDPPSPIYSIVKWIVIAAFWAALVLVFIAGFASVGAIGHALFKLIIS